MNCSRMVEFIKIYYNITSHLPPNLCKLFFGAQKVHLPVKRACVCGFRALTMCNGGRVFFPPQSAFIKGGNAMSRATNEVFGFARISF